MKNSIKRLLIKFRDTGAVNRLTGSGRPQSAHTEENVYLVNLTIWFWIKTICHRLTEWSM